jgi:hypothetical protein
VPFVITNVSQTQLSIARHFMAITYNGYRFAYNPMRDELVRDDVLAWRHKKTKEKKKARRKELKDKQLGLDIQ